MPAVPAGLSRRVLRAVALAEQTIETVTIFGQDGFTAPGGPMNVYLGAALVSICCSASGSGWQGAPTPRRAAR